MALIQLPPYNVTVFFTLYHYIESAVWRVNRRIESAAYRMTRGKFCIVAVRMPPNNRQTLPPSGVPKSGSHLEPPSGIPISSPNLELPIWSSQSGAPIWSPIWTPIWSPHLDPLCWALHVLYKEKSVLVRGSRWEEVCLYKPNTSYQLVIDIILHLYCHWYYLIIMFSIMSQTRYSYLPVFYEKCGPFHER